MQKFVFSSIGILLISPVFGTPEKPNFQDDLVPVFEQSCNSCHNPDKARGGLDLTSMNAILAGGSSGEVALPGDADGSLLFTLAARLQEPHMPPRGDKIENSQLLIIKNWINQGLLPTASGKPIQKKKPSFNLALSSISIGKPKGPVPLPKHLDLQPVFVAERTFAPSAMATAPWSPLTALSGQKQVLLYHTDNYRLLGVLPFEEGFVESLHFSRNGKLILASGGKGGKSGRVVGWDVETGQRVLTLGEEQDSILTADILADQSLIAIGGTNKLIKVLDVATGEILYKIKKHSEWVTQVSFSPDGILLATGDRNGGVHVWEARTGNPFYTLEGHKEEITSLSWRSDGNVLSSASEDGTVRIWEMINGKQVRTWNAHSSGILSAHYGQNGNIVTSGRDKVVKIWDGNGKGLRTISEFSDIVMEARLSHDGSKIVAGDWTGAVHVFNTSDGKKLASLNSNPLTIEKRIENLEKGMPHSKNLVQELKSQILPFQQKFEELTAKLAFENNKQNEYTSEINNQQKHLDHLKKRQNDQKIDSGKINQNISGLKSIIQQNDKRIKDLDLQKNNASKACHNLRKQILEGSEIVAGLNKKHTDLIAKISQDSNNTNLKNESLGIKKKITLKNTDIANWKESLKQEEHKLSQTQKSLVNEQNTQLKSKAELQQLTKRLQTTNNSLAEVLDEMKLTETNLAKSKSNLANCNSVLSSLAKDLAKAKEALNSPTQKISEAEKKLQAHLQELQKWKAELINHDRHLQVADLNDAKATQDIQEEVFAEAKYAFEDATAELDKASESLRNLPQKIIDAEENLREKRNLFEIRKDEKNELLELHTQSKSLLEKSNDLMTELGKRVIDEKQNLLLSNANQKLIEANNFLKQEVASIDSKLKNQDQTLALATSEINAAEIRVSEVTELKDRLPAIIRDKKSLADAAKNELDKKSTELTRLNSVVKDREKNLNLLFQKYLNTLPN